VGHIEHVAHETEKPREGETEDPAALSETSSRKVVFTVEHVEAGKLVRSLRREAPTLTKVKLGQRHRAGNRRRDLAPGDA
jgi:hypothetical protein